MSEPAVIYIAGLGMITPVGNNTQMTVAAVRAGISAYKVSDYYNKNDKPMTITSVPDEALAPLDEKLKWIGLTSREKRLLQLATPAITELVSKYKIPPGTPLFLSGPENLPGGAKPISSRFLDYLNIQTGLNFDSSKSRYLASGRSGVIEAIELAFKYFEATTESLVIVGGLDTYNDLATLSKLDVEDRVLAENINDGFAPGEAAAFILVSRYPLKSAQNIILFRPGFCKEVGHRYSDETYTGQGLATAVRLAADNSAGKKISKILSCVNGESLFSKEIGVAVIRNSDQFDENYINIHPADCLGDVGAATGAVLISVSVNELCNVDTQKQHLVYCSSDLANRSAICISK